MKKLMIVAAMLVMVAVVGIVPAMAAGRHGGFNQFDPNAFSNPNAFFNQFNHRNDVNPNNFDANNGGGGVSQGFAERNTSGNVDNSFTATSSGDNSNQCVTPLQFGNTGSQQNIQGSLQYASFSGDQDFTGPSFKIAPLLSGGCNQAVQQSSAASSN